MQGAGSRALNIWHRISERTRRKGQRLTALVFRNATDDTADARRIRWAAATTTISTRERTVCVKSVTEWKDG